MGVRSLGHWTTREAPAVGIFNWWSLPLKPAVLAFSFLGFCFLLFSLNLKIHMTLTFSILTCGRCHVTSVAACWQKAFCVLCPTCVSGFGAPRLGVLGAVPRLGAQVQ